MYYFLLHVTKVTKRVCVLVGLNQQIINGNKKKNFPQGLYYPLTDWNWEETYQSISSCGCGNPCLCLIGCWDLLFLHADSVSEHTRQASPLLSRVVREDHPWIRKSIFLSWSVGIKSHMAFTHTQTHKEANTCGWLHLHRKTSQSSTWCHKRRHEVKRQFIIQFESFEPKSV